MLKKTVTFLNLNTGEHDTEDLYFHLNKADMVELELSAEGGLSKKLQEVVDSNDGNQIIQTFKDLLLRAYGEKSPDGRSFIKTQELRDKFQSSEAYSALFMELVTDASKAAEFVNGIVPAGLEQDVAKLVEARQEQERVEDATHGNIFRDNPSKPVDTPPPGEAPREIEKRILTKAEAVEMSSSELSHLLATGQAVISEE